MPAKPKYTPAEKTAYIDGALQSIATGQSLNAFCKANNVAYMTMSDWLNENEAVKSAREAAIKTGTHYLAAECLDIADELAQEKRLPLDPALSDGEKDGLAAKVQLARLRIDTRIRLIGKWNRKEYGEKQEIDANVKHTIDDALQALVNRDG